MSVFGFRVAYWASFAVIQVWGVVCFGYLVGWWPFPNPVLSAIVVGCAGAVYVPIRLVPKWYAKARPDRAG